MGTRSVIDCPGHLLTTRRRETAPRLFEDAGYPWPLQGHVALLSASDPAPPNVDGEALLALTADDWKNHAGRLHSMGVSDAPWPGIDGDVIGVLSLTDDVRQTPLNALAQQAKLAGFRQLRLSEEDFSSRL